MDAIIKKKGNEVFRLKQTILLRIKHFNFVLQANTYPTEVQRTLQYMVVFWSDILDNDLDAIEAEAAKKLPDHQAALFIFTRQLAKRCPSWQFSVSRPAAEISI